MRSDSKKTEKKNAPVERFRIGSVTLTAWENESKEGNKFLNFTLEKRYFDGKEWKDTESLGVQDLAVLQTLVGRALEFSMTYSSASEESA